MQANQYSIFVNELCRYDGKTDATIARTIAEQLAIENPTALIRVFKGLGVGKLQYSLSLYVDPFTTAPPCWMREGVQA